MCAGQSRRSREEPTISVPQLLLENQRLQATVQRLELDQRKIKGELDFQKQRSSVSTKRAKKDRTALRQIEHENVRLAAEVQAAAETLNVAWEERTEQQATWAELAEKYRHRLQKAKQREKEDKQAIAKLQSDMHRLGSSVNVVVSETTQAVAEANAREKVEAEKVSRLVSELQQLQEDTAQLQEDLAAANRSAVTANKHADQARRSEGDLHRRLGKASDQLRRVQGELTSAREQHTLGDGPKTDDHAARHCGRGSRRRSPKWPTAVCAMCQCPLRPGGQRCRVQLRIPRSTVVSAQGGSEDMR